MEDICITCKKPAEVACSCDNTLRFCYKDFFEVHKYTQGTHLNIDLDTMKHNKKLIFTIENLNRVKSQIISNSNKLIHIIDFIATKKITIIKKCIDACIQVSKSKDLEKIFKHYENIHIQETDLGSFEKKTNKIFSLFKDNYKILDSDLEKFLTETKKKNDNKIFNQKVESLLNKTNGMDFYETNPEKLFEETKVESLKTRVNLEKTQKELQSNFDLFLEEKTLNIKCVAVTCDNNYVITGSKDSTIRV